MKDCDPTTGIPDSDEGYDDEYMLEDFDVIVADQVKKTKVNNFTAAWDSADSDGKDSVNISTSITTNIFLIHFQNGWNWKRHTSWPLLTRFKRRFKPLLNSWDLRL